jgi:hypothetical protein
MVLAVAALALTSGSVLASGGSGGGGGGKVATVRYT